MISDATQNLTAILKSMKERPLIWLLVVWLSGWALFAKTVLPSWLSCAPMLLLLIVMKYIPFAFGGGAKLAMFIEGGLAMAVGALGIWRWALAPAERAALARKLPLPFLRRQAA